MPRPVFAPEKAADGAGLGKGGIQNCLERDGQQGRLPGQSGQQGPGQQFKGGGSGKGIAGQGQHRFPVTDCVHGGSTRLDLYPPELLLGTQQGEGLVEDILVAYRYPAGGEQQIALGQKFLHGLGHSGGLIPLVAVDCPNTQLRQPGGQYGPVGPVDFAGGEGDAGGKHLVPGGKQAHPGAAAHRHTVKSGTGQQADGGGIQPGTLLYQQAAFHIVLSTVHIVLKGGQRDRNTNRVLPVCMLLGCHTVTAGGQHGPRHNPDGLTGANRKGGRIAGIQGVYHLQNSGVFLVCSRQIGGAEGIAVQRGAVKGGLILGGREILGQGAAKRFRQQQVFCTEGGEGICHTGDSLFQ